MKCWQVPCAHKAARRGQVPDYELQSVYELPLVLLLGALCGLVSTMFQGACAVGAHAPRLGLCAAVVLLNRVWGA